jgi:hypothetical protein
MPVKANSEETIFVIVSLSKIMMNIPLIFKVIFQNVIMRCLNAFDLVENCRLFEFD